MVPFNYILQLFYSGMCVFGRYFESGNYVGFIKSKVVPYIAQKFNVEVKGVFAVPVFLPKDISLRVQKNESLSRSQTGAAQVAGLPWNVFKGPPLAFSIFRSRQAGLQAKNRTDGPSSEQSGT